MKIDKLLNDLKEELNIISVANGLAEQMLKERQPASNGGKNEFELLNISNKIATSVSKVAKGLDDLRNTLYSFSRIEAISTSRG